MVSYSFTGVMEKPGNSGAVTLVTDTCTLNSQDLKMLYLQCWRHKIKRVCFLIQSRICAINWLPDALLYVCVSFSSSDFLRKVLKQKRQQTPS